MFPDEFGINENNIKRFLLWNECFNDIGYLLYIIINDYLKMKI